MISALLFNRYTLALATAAAVLAAIYFGIDSIRRAGEREAEERQRAVALAADLMARDSAIRELRTALKEERGRAKANADALARKQDELKASSAALAQARKEYRDALDQLSDDERQCASRRVPAAVDRLLGGVPGGS